MSSDPLSLITLNIDICCYSWELNNVDSLFWIPSRMHLFAQRQPYWEQVLMRTEELFLTHVGWGLTKN